MSDRKRIVRGFIVEKLMFGDDTGLEDETPFLAEGIVDSTGFLELILFLEETFDIQVADAEMIPENLDSLERVDAYVRSKLDEAPASVR